MSHKTVLLDLENNMPTAQLLRDIMQHYPTVYVFNCAGQFNFPLVDLNEFAGWVTSGQIIVLDTPTAEYKEFEYAVLVGQLMALLEDDTHVEVISAMPSSEMLIKLLQGSEISAHLILVQPETLSEPEHQAKFSIPTVATIKSKPMLYLVKQYCDALDKMTGKPNTVAKLKNSVGNVLHLVPEKAQHLVGMLINLKIVKRYDDQINFRKKVLKEWLKINLNEDAAPEQITDLNGVVAQFNTSLEQVDTVAQPQTAIQHAQQDLFKNFSKIDPIQVEVARKLRELKDDKPKDIYALRDLLEEMFPKADIRRLLKELIEKGYIYWNGHEVVYSHEMFLN